jgi:hypothetical protein
MIIAFMMIIAFIISSIREISNCSKDNGWQDLGGSHGACDQDLVRVRGFVSLTISNSGEQLSRCQDHPK